MGGRTLELAMLGATLAVTLTAEPLAAETHKEYRFNVGPRAGISVNNPYGSVSVRPSTGNFVVIRAALSSDKVEVDNNVAGNHIEVVSHLLPGADAHSGSIDYEILVPADA